MFTVQIKFGTSDPAQDKTKQSDAINAVFGSWRMNGQILGRQFPFAAPQGSYLCYTNIAEQDSLAPRHNNKYVSSSLASLKDAGLGKPDIIVLGAEPEAAPVCGCDSSSGHIVYTTFLSVEPPLRCANCFGVVPLYKIPPTYDNSEYYNIISWQSDFQNIDHVQMNCKVEERLMIGLLFDPKSELSQQGLEVCRTIKQATKKPVYYYLMQGNEAKSLEAEQARKCPSCGGDWLQDKPWHDLFDFRCDTCSLVSNIAWTINNDEK